MARYTVSILETCMYHLDIEAPQDDPRTAAAEARKQFLRMTCEEQLSHCQGIEERSFDVLGEASSQAFDDSEFSDED